MKNTKFLLLSLLVAFLFITSCSKDDEETTPQVNESEVLVNYLESTNSPLGKDFVNTDMPTIMPAVDVFTLNATGQVYIIDIRSAADFATGHIANAHNVALGDILTHIEGVDLSSYTKVAIVCYTGQTAGFAASLLRILGYDNVYSMKWGMCSWNEEFATKWNTAAANGNAFSTQFVSTSTAKGAQGNLPSLSTGKTTGQDILEARIDAVLEEGFSAAAVSNTAVFTDLNNYYIVNYWPAVHYTDLGHIPGAMQYTPKETIKLSADLKTLPTDKAVVVYCYTGQNSAFLTAYLRVLGYDAKSLLYGANGMIYDNLNDAGLTVWSESQIMGYEYVN